jgi:CDP-glycerol glycerophosphotransferase (TagB/SpsB family)
MMRALRGTALRALRSLDDAVGRLSGPAEVLVDVRTPMNLAVLRPVWTRLLGDPRVSVRFTAEADTAIAGGAADPAVEARRIARASATWTRLDLALTADLWNRTPLRRCRRQVNFFHGVAGKYDLDDAGKVAAANLDQFDRIAFINADRLERWVASGVIRRTQAALVGFPKVDELLNGRWNPADVRASLRLAPGRPTVLYAPTFSPESSLQLAGEAIVQALLDAGYNVIVKLHDRSMVPHERYTDGIDWPARLSAFSGRPGFAFARLSDAGPCLAAADVLVTDHSTVGFEFALLDRPIVVFDAPRLREAARIAADKWFLLRSMADVVDTAPGVADAVTRALQAPSEMRAARRQAHTLFAHAGHATERALAVVYDLLEMEPAAADARSAAGAPAAPPAS